MQQPVIASREKQSRFALWIKSLRAQHRQDLLFAGFMLLLVFVVMLIIAGVVLTLITNAWLSLTQMGGGFFTNLDFDPVHNTFGALPAIWGTIVTSVFAIIFAIPLGVGTAIFLVDFCPRGLRLPLAFFADLLAAIPSVVFGLWGFLVMVPWLQNTGEPWLQTHLGFLPFFQGPPRGVGLLAAGMILTVMILPLIISISREVMLTVPPTQREALLALGATRWEVIRHAVLPFSRIGILGGVILALGRALGETMAVTLVVGNQATRPSLSLFSPGYTLASVIANQFQEATPGLFYSALLEAGLVLFILTLITNVLARVLITQLSRKSGGHR